MLGYASGRKTENLTPFFERAGDNFSETGCTLKRKGQ
jgi:hypothetical protein